eukprot:m.4864 g.4864  ORF g.4864 m.4864 type:complete len:194 (+) comp3119_c0_seq1:176-757(+)
MSSEDDGDWEALDEAGTFEAEAQKALEKREEQDRAEKLAAETAAKLKLEQDQKQQEKKLKEHELNKKKEDALANSTMYTLKCDALIDLTNSNRAGLPPAPPVAQPAIKILKRPTQNKDNVQKSVQPTPQQKSIAEREAEYAAARARIMGANEQRKPVVAVASNKGANLIREPVGPGADVGPGPGGFKGRGKPR